MSKEEKLKKERITVMQIFSEMYLRKRGLPPSDILFDSVDEYGELSNEQIKLLHFYLMEEYQKMGLDLISCIKRTGEKIEPGKLSKYEIKELISRADDMIYFLGVLGMRREAALKEKKEA